MKPEWGTKHECHNCGAHFYDMRKPDACCPKCNTPINDKATLMAKTADFDETPVKKEHDPLGDFEDVDTTLMGEDGEEDFIEDADDLVGNDETDMSEIMEHVDDGVVDQNL